MRTINFGKYLRFFEIEPIKTVEIIFIQIGKKKAKTLHAVYKTGSPCFTFAFTVELIHEAFIGQSCHI